LPGKNLSLFASLRELYDTARGVRSTAELDVFLDRAARLIGETLGWGSVVVNIHRRAWDDFYVTTVHGDDAARDALLGTSQAWDAWGPLMHARFDRRGAYMVPHDSIDFDGLGIYVYDPPPVSDDSPGRWHHEDLLIVPMPSGSGELNGILSVDHPASGLVPSDDDLDALVIIASAAGAALDQTREATANAEHRAALQELLAVSTRIADARSTDVVLEAVCHGIRDALGFDRAAVVLPGADGRALQGVAAAGWDLDDPALRLDMRSSRWRSCCGPSTTRTAASCSPTRTPSGSSGCASPTTSRATTASARGRGTATG